MSCRRRLRSDLAMQLEGPDPYAQLLEGGTLTISFLPFVFLGILSLGRKPASLSNSCIAPASDAPAIGVPECERTAVNP